MPLLQHAIDYALAGWPVIPLRGKIPVTEHGSKDWTVDPVSVAAHDWYGIGVVTGVLFFVVDIDGEKGHRGWMQLLGENELPITPMAKTRRGKHFYFLMPKRREIQNSVGLIAPGVDVRGAGGYVVAPPSPHPSGGLYEWIIDYRDTDLADAPGWLLAALRKPKRGPSGRGTMPQGEDRFAVESVAPIPDGSRNTKLYQLACAGFAKGKPIETVAAEVKWINIHRCQPPKSDREIDGIIKSASRHAV